MATELLKSQNRSLALQNVQKGIILFKENRNLEASVYYNKALSIDEDNVEAYVARGAMYIKMKLRLIISF
jgi:tetratricopeptide (TPR) repeat protein